MPSAQHRSSSGGGNSSSGGSGNRHHSTKTTRLQLEIPRVVVGGSSSFSISSRNQRNRRYRKSCRFYCTIIWILGLFLFILNRTTRLIPIEQYMYSTDSLLTKVKLDQYDNVQSIQDLSTETVQYWCQDAISSSSSSLFREDCNKCRDPLVPEGRQEDPIWEHIHHKNVDIVNSIPTDEIIDVVFIGDSITEGWHGTLKGKEMPNLFGNSQKVFQTYFNTANGGKFQGIPLGIAGDTSPNLLWRLQHDELPDHLTPSVFWLLIGTNDLTKGCSPEVIIIGILRIVEELRAKRPGSIIVINGLLPRTTNRMGYVTRSGGSIGKNNGNGNNGNGSSSGYRHLPVLWEYLKVINIALNRYAQQREKVVYFETNIFFKDPAVNKETELQIDKTLMVDYLHPHAKGYDLWAKEITNKLNEILGGSN